MLPDAATIGHEKTLQNIENFDVTTLKHAQTSESQAGTFCKYHWTVHNELTVSTG